VSDAWKMMAARILSDTVVAIWVHGVIYQIPPSTDEKKGDMVDISIPFSYEPRGSAVAYSTYLCGKYRSMLKQ